MNILIIKAFYLVAKIIGYVNYYISDNLILQKSYDINTTFIVLNQSNSPNNKILNWKDKSSGSIIKKQRKKKKVTLVIKVIKLY